MPKNRWTMALSVLAASFILTCAQPADWNADIETFVEEGKSLVSFDSAVFQSGGEVGYLSSATGETVIRLNIFNPKKFDVTYNLTWDGPVGLFDSAPVLDPVTNPRYAVMRFDPSLMAEHTDLVFHLGFFVTELNRNFPAETFSFRCESVPNPVEGIIGGLDSNENAMVAFRLPVGDTDDDLYRIRISWGVLGGGKTTDIFDIIDLTVPPDGNTLLNDGNSQNRYFVPAIIDKSKTYVFDVVLIDIPVNPYPSRQSEVRSAASQIVERTLTYDPNAVTYTGTVPAPQTVIYGSSQLVADNTGNLVRTGYAFDGWRTGKTSGTRYSPGAVIDNFTANMTLYAVWTLYGEVTITIDLPETGGNTLTFSAPAQTLYAGQAYTLAPSGTSALAALTTGWTWYVNGVAQGDTDNILNWTPSAAGQYVIGCTVPYGGVLYSGSALVTVNSVPTVSYSANGGEWKAQSIPTTSHLPGNTVTVTGPAADLVARSGYLFLGWALAANAGSATCQVNGSSYSFNMPETSVVLYAVWQDVAPPPVTNLTAVVGNGTITLSWTEPTVADYHHVVISGNFPGAPLNVYKGVTNRALTGLTIGNTYDIAVEAFDTGGNGSGSVTVTVMTLPAGTPNPFTLGGVNLNMIYVPGRTFPTGAADSGVAVVNTGYWISTTETGSFLWNKVRQWITENGNNYTLSAGISSSGYPIRGISIRDAMVWCNALTEYSNAILGTTLTFVYLDPANQAPIRDTAYFDATNKDPMINTGATGFRLPTTDEWELAARYIWDFNADGDIRDPGEYYHGDFASGSDAPCGVTATVDYDGNTHVYSATDVTVYEGSLCYPISKNCNILGCYDMSGNVWEYVYVTPSLNGAHHYRRGGSYSGGSMNSYYYLGNRITGDDVSYMFWGGAEDNGFRFVRNGEALP